jgi:Zn-dependent protease with chaperone function
VSKSFFFNKIIIIIIIIIHSLFLSFSLSHSPLVSLHQSPPTSNSNNSMILYWAFGIPLPVGALELALFLPNSRAAETEADVIGVRLAARACYDPSAAATVFEKLGQAEKDSGGAGIPAFMRTVSLEDVSVFSSSLKKAFPFPHAIRSLEIPNDNQTPSKQQHPLSEARVKRVRQELPEAMKLYEKAGCSLPRSSLRQFINVLTGEEEEVEFGSRRQEEERRRRRDDADDGSDDDPVIRIFEWRSN